MAALQQKRPSISNWFSSLRRKPKNNKKPSSDSLLGSAVDKQFQRSCIDLSTNSTFYVHPADAKASATQHQRIDFKRMSSTTGGAGGVASTDNIHDNGANKDDDRRGLVTGKRVSQLCLRCCCNMVLPHSRSNTPPTSLTQTATKRTITSPVITSSSSSPPPLPSPSLPFTSVATYQISPLSPTTSTLSSRTVTESDVSRNVTTLRLPSDERDNSIIVKKRFETKHRTTTTTTRTLITSRPVELILNERGEVVARRPPSLDKSGRSNSLGCVLDTNTETEEDADSCVSYSPGVGALQARAADEAGELRFIDDSSTSQSENEQHSQNNGKHLSDAGYGNVEINAFPRTFNSTTQNNNNYNNCNYNHNDLCDVCKNVVQLNRTNSAQSAVIMRNQQIKDELCEVVSEMEALDVPEDCKHSNKDKQMSIGRKKFNMDPKKGIEYLVENRLLRHDPQDVAHFLYKGEGLNKTAIGDYLGEKNDFNEDVLKAFVALHDFTNLILVQALRQFLWSFRLPGEAQKIDRMMECFAQRYCQLNPDIFTNTDTCYVLSFAIIMLNTSLHNPSVKDKPTVEQFISMNRGINNGGDLPRGLLESLYESIRTEPFKIPQDDGNDLMHTFFNPDKEGWLWKQGGRYKSWKRRWFILNDNCLYYFEYTTDKEPRGIIPLENISVREIHDRSKPHCFELFATGGADIIKACKTDSEGKVVEGKHTVYRMSAATEEDQQEWIKRLTQSISHNPFYDILVQRKKKALSKS